MKICLAGTGAMGVIHMKALKKIAGVDVVSVNSRTKRAARRSPRSGTFRTPRPSLEACIDRPGVDAVILTTPSSMHADQTVMALGKGKHVQVEIPMSLNLPDAERIVAAATSVGKDLHGHAHAPLLVAASRDPAPHPGRHRSTCTTWSSKRISSAARTLNMHGQPRSWVDNLLWHHGCHSVDLAHWILGEPNFEVWGQKGPDHPELGIPMDMTVAMKSKKGPLFSMAMSFNNKGPFGGFYRYIGEEETYKVYRDSMTDSEGKEVPLDGVAAFDRQDVEFTSAIREGREPESSARQLPADDGAARSGSRRSMNRAA